MSANCPNWSRCSAGSAWTTCGYRTCRHSFGDTDPAGAYREIREYAADQALWTGADRRAAEAAYERAGRLAREHGVALRLPEPAGPTRPGCGWPWDSAYVTSQGVVQPCCMVMGDDRMSLGRLSERSFPEIWAGPAYQEFRRRLRDGDPPEVCRGCAMYHGVF